MKTVALTCSAEDDKLFIKHRYLEYISATADRMGVDILPIILPVTDQPRIVKEYARRFDGYIFTGGGDISPHLYGEQKSHLCGGIEHERDFFELHLMKELIPLDRPIIGICRGCQVINTAFGGTLWQDHSLIDGPLSPHITDGGKTAVSHKVNVTGMLEKLIGKNSFFSNSYHHQSVKDIGEGLITCGVCDDGIVEAIWHKKMKLCLGVQWHPEIEPDEISFKIMKKFIDVL